MKKKLLLVFLLFCLAIFLRPALPGLDSYYYASLSCGKIAPNQIDIGFNSEFWKLIPCDFAYFKALICLVFGLCLLLFYQIAKLIDEKHAETYSLFFFLNPFLLAYLANMENDLIAAPIIFLSLYFSVKYVLRQNKWDYFLSVFLAAVGILVWKQMAIWFLILLTVEFGGALIASGLFILYFIEFLTSLDRRILDNVPGVGLLGSLYLLFGLKDTPKALLLPVAISLVFAFIALKFALFAGVLLTIGAILFVQRKKWLEKSFHKNLVFGILLLFFLMGIPNLFWTTPSQSTIDSIQSAVKKANGSQIENDYWVGYMIIMFDGNAKRYGGLPEPDFNILKGIKITQNILPCIKFGEIKESFLIAEPKNGYLYDCK